MAGRSQHRSQDQGQLEEPGPRIDRLAFIEWRDREGGRGTKDGDGLFAGVDTLFPGKARYAALIESARAQLNPPRRDAIAPLLARALGELGAADSGQQAILEGALAAAAGVVIDGFADDGIVIPGERVQVETSVWNAGDARLTLDGIELSAPAGWRVERLDAMSSPVPRGTLATRRFAVTVAADAPRSQAYFLRRPLVGALYDWSGVPAAWRGLPFEPPPVQMTDSVCSPPGRGGTWTRRPSGIRFRTGSCSSSSRSCRPLPPLTDLWRPVSSAGRPPSSPTAPTCPMPSSGSASRSYSWWGRSRWSGN